MSEVTSTFQKRPCYRYIRKTDKLPERFPADVSIDEIVCKVKLFNPQGMGTWWIAAYDPRDGTAWGVADLFEREVGTFYIPELVAFRGAFGLPIERDIYYKPKTVREILEG